MEKEQPMNIADFEHKYKIYKYIYKFKNGVAKGFNVIIDAANLQLVGFKKENIPDWARLSFFKCSNCPLIDKKGESYCPAALSVYNIVDAFEEYFSYEKVEVYVRSKNRNYYKSTTLQEGLSSLFGICLATSGCPNLSILKPMAINHLPFSTPKETIFRVLSTYLLGQFVTQKKSVKPDWNMHKLKEHYKQIKVLNENFSQRLENIKIKSANLNAMIILGDFSDKVINVINSSDESLEGIYNACFTQKKFNLPCGDTELKEKNQNVGFGLGKIMELEKRFSQAVQEQKSFTGEDSPIDENDRLLQELNEAIKTSESIVKSDNIKIISEAKLKKSGSTYFRSRNKD